MSDTPSPAPDQSTRTFDMSGQIQLPNPPDRSHLPEWANERPHVSVADRGPFTRPTIDGGLSGPHPVLASEDQAQRAMLDHQYRNANGETTSRITLVGVIEEGTRSFQSMDTWLCNSAAHLKVAGVGVPKLRRVRDQLQKLMRDWHSIGEDIASQRRR